MALVEVAGDAAPEQVESELVSAMPWRSIRVSLRFGLITCYNMFDVVHVHYWYCKCRIVSTYMFFSKWVCSSLRARKDQLDPGVCGDLTAFINSKVWGFSIKLNWNKRCSFIFWYKSCPGSGITTCFSPVTFGTPLKETWHVYSHSIWCSVKKKNFTYPRKPWRQQFVCLCRRRCSLSLPKKAIRVGPYLFCRKAEPCNIQLPMRFPLTIAGCFQLSECGQARPWWSKMSWVNCHGKFFG